MHDYRQINMMKRKNFMTEDASLMILNAISDLRTEVSDLRTLATDTNRRVKALEISYENDLRPGIREIAGAHLDLSRKLDVAMQFEKEREIIMIQINYHDSELKRLKVRLDELESCG